MANRPLKKGAHRVSCNIHSVSSHAPAGTPEPTIVVGGRSITPHDVGLEAQYHPAASWEHAYHHAQRALVVRELLLLECERQCLVAARPNGERDTQDAIERLLDQALPKQAAEEPACLAYYDAHATRFVGAPLYDASHILLAAHRGDQTSRALAKKHAEALRAELLASPELFERRARELSGCPSAANDGRLGQIALGDTEPEFEAALLPLEVGALSDVVETSAGYHVIRLEARAPGAQLPFDLVKAKIRLYLEERAFRAALHDYVLALAERYGVSGFDLLSTPPEVTPVPKRVAGPRRLSVVNG